MENTLIWTVCYPAPLDARQVNPSPDGWQMIRPCPYSALTADAGGDEAFFEACDFVVSKDGKLLGFLVTENIVLCKDDFTPGGRFYDTDGIILRRWGSRVEFVYLTCSRW